MNKGMQEMTKDAKMDMTPMIDCVFLLMIFFVLVIDLSQQDLEALILPKADYQELDENPPKIRPIVNINQRGEMIYKTEVWYDPAVSQQDYSGIDNLLLYFKNDIVEDTEPFQIGPNLITLVNDPILIRADKWTEWHYIRTLMERCSLPSLAFWKLELAMSEEDKETKLLKSQGRK
jgi:biopolymer transport protein ExbD